MTISLPADPTLDEIHAFLAPAIAREATFDGWSEAALVSAATSAGVDPGAARLAFPGGAMDMIDAWIESIDRDMLAAFPVERIAAMKIRERIRSLVAFRLEAVAADKEALRRASSIMALPSNLKRSARIGWRTADRMWRLAGDTATDYNHYTKRMTLTGVYASTLAVFLDDDSDDFIETRAFLDRRIENVMQFEKTKAQWLNPDREHFSITRFLGRLRYPAR